MRIFKMYNYHGAFTGVNGSTIIFCFWRIVTNWVSTSRLKKHCSGKFNKNNSEDSIESLSYTKIKIYYYKPIPMSITAMSCYLILLIIDANPVGCTETQVGQLLCRCTLWCDFCWFTSDDLEWENSVGWTMSCPLEEVEGGGRIEEDDIVFPPLWSLFGGDVIVEGHVIFVGPAGLNVTPNITSPLPKAFLTLWHAQESSCVADWDNEEGTLETFSLSSSIDKWSAK